MLYCRSCGESEGEEMVGVVQRREKDGRSRVQE